MATNKTVSGYEKKSAGQKSIPAKSQSEGAGGNSADHSAKLMQAGVQEDDLGAAGPSVDHAIAHHVAALGGLVGVKRAAKETHTSGSQNLFAGGAGGTGLNSQAPWSKNSGSQSAY